ncbi:creatininase family protein [Alicyclobacillus dauci]|uniref:Creatininase family protein n=1 Tax=Alicyclobacillus dauci TaxID=1475485 RepID=A0ABY6Z0K0_9BACL|nr:creatininase family protein [Alicyclobacillus dauci]WAH36362.1 creatininase family protein [Alicyclobacillus dauci]WAH39372.1 creatininase family protein [Alicyclobacillus dauci]
MSKVLEWGNLTWPEFVKARKTTNIAVLPIGAIEEHGPHLPLNTDNVAADAFARLVCGQTGAFLLPTMPLGQVWSLKRFPGSLTISNDTLKAIIRDLSESLQMQAIKGLILISGHLGNMAALKEAAREVQESLQFPVMYLFYPSLNEASKGVMEAPTSHPSIVHADELETSILLSLRPDVVKMDRAVREYPDYPADFDVVPTFWDEVNESGVFGDATMASKEKGDAIMRRVVDKAVELVEHFKKAVNQTND